MTVRVLAEKGHKTLAMVERHAHLTEGHTASIVARIMAASELATLHKKTGARPPGGLSPSRASQDVWLDREAVELAVDGGELIVGAHPQPLGGELLVARGVGVVEEEPDRDPFRVLGEPAGGCQVGRIVVQRLTQSAGQVVRVLTSWCSKDLAHRRIDRYPVGMGPHPGHQRATPAS